MKRFLVALAFALSATGCVLGGEDEEPIDAAPIPDCGCTDTLPDSFNPCGQCGPGTVCVQLLGGACGTVQVTCEPIVTGCDQPVCSPACDQAYCDPGGISTCSAAPCPGVDIPGAFHCYGV